MLWIKHCEIISDAAVRKFTHFRRCKLFHVCMHNVSYITTEHDNSPLVVSACTRGGTCAAWVPAQFIIYMLPLSSHCDLEEWMTRQREKTKRRKLKYRGRQWEKHERKEELKKKRGEQIEKHKWFRSLWGLGDLLSHDVPFIESSTLNSLT